MAPIYRSKYDPYDVNRRQPYEQFDERHVRVRVWRNEMWKGNVWKFDMVQAVPRGKTDEISRGIPLEDALDAALCMQKFLDWALPRNYGSSPGKK